MDPIADMLTIIKNGYAVRKKTVSLPFSWMKYEILELLKREGFIDEVKKRGKLFTKKGARKRIVVSLKYVDGIPALSGTKRISTPGRHLYKKARELPLSRKGGVIIVSTSRGLMTTERARKENIGGELICEVW